MTILHPGSGWDYPFFKILARNDTGEGVGHQSGVVIPKLLTQFFTDLTGNITSENPTDSIRISTQLFIGNNYLGTVNARYQYQTWGGERSPEARLTDNLRPLLGEASADDILLFQQHSFEQGLYKLTLVRQSNPEYAAIRNMMSSRQRWGVLGENPPVRQIDVSVAAEEQTRRENEPFRLFDDNAEIVETRKVAVARDRAFKNSVLALYSCSCVVSGPSIRTPTDRFEIEVAHIVPRSFFGVDDVRNGIPLRRTFHWAFDNGLFGIDEDYQVIVPDCIARIGENRLISELHGSDLLLPSEDNRDKWPDRSALEWHRDNILVHD